MAEKPEDATHYTRNAAGPVYWKSDVPGHWLRWGERWGEQALAPAERPVPIELPTHTTMTAPDYLSEALRVQQERGEDYDKPGGERSFAATAAAYNAITGRDLKGSDVALMLNLLKYVRQYSDPTRLHTDSLVDAVGYSSLWAGELTQELQE